MNPRVLHADGTRASPSELRRNYGTSEGLNRIYGQTITPGSGIPGGQEGERRNQMADLYQ